MTEAPDSAPDRHPLNDRQREAIEHGDGPLMVLAGAGTGKTRVLVHRIARLVESGAPPWQILAVTFTNKAAGEMRGRLRELLGDAADAMWIGTFHATCAKLLRRFGEHAGLRRGFAIFDDDDQVKVIERLLRDAGLRDQVSPRAILARIDRAKNRGADPSEPTGTLDDVVQQIYPLYQARLARENAVDFNDLLIRTGTLFEKEPAKTSLETKFTHVLVDEFQDTNRVQYELVRQFSQATRNLTVVGDDDQSIYAWRGAEPRNLLDFDRDFPDARVVKLEQNYRSSQRILDAANGVIEKNADRHDKALWTQRSGGAPIKILVADDERGEAQQIVQSIGRLLGGAEPHRLATGPGKPTDSPATRPGRPADSPHHASSRATDSGGGDSHRRACDVAILFRTNAQARVLEEHLRAAQIPARVVGATSFFDRREIRDALAYLRLIANPGADVAFERVVNVPTRGIGDATVDRIRLAARASEVSLLESSRLASQGRVSGVGPVPRRKLQAFVELIDDLRGVAASGSSVSEILVRAIERSGLRAKLEDDQSDESRDRLNNLAELVTAATDFGDEAKAAQATREKATRRQKIGQAQAPADFPDPASPAGSAGLADDDEDASAPPTVNQFLERIALSSAEDESLAGERVSLMTIHIAKGLEWPIVFVAGMEDGLFPSLRPRDDVDEQSALEEERRLAYVAITRARDRLTMTHARTRRTRGEIRIQDPSRFLGDLPSQVVARPAVAGGGSDSRAIPSFDPRGAGAMTEPDPPTTDPDRPVELGPGVRVRHASLGAGCVQEILGTEASLRAVVDFDLAGRKTVLTGFLGPE